MFNKQECPLNVGLNLAEVLRDVWGSREQNRSLRTRPRTRLLGSFFSKCFANEIIKGPGMNPVWDSRSVEGLSSSSLTFTPPRSA